ncbi:AAA family ATPase [Virgibacillus dakarensis]|uniref:AAA family ATPase n=1 Tax=Virgibacillus dakarensis TaxID=1917889 RepID=UPI001F1FD18D|nr:AAA family ATPase [Virgibacillus dakarensis]
MKLHSLRIQGFRRHIDTKIVFSNATFLIGENNIGKSSVLKALEYLLTDTKKIPADEFFSTYSEDTGDHTYLTDEIILTAEFRNLPSNAKDWRGFKGRLLKYDITDTPDETGYMVVYKKIFKPNKDYVVEMREYEKSLKEEFKDCKTLQDFIDSGLSANIINELFPTEDVNKTLTKSSKVYKSVITIDDLYNIDESIEKWVENPGGIPGNVLVKLPKFLLIPAQDKIDEISGSSGALKKTLNSLFEDVRDASDHFSKVQHYLSLLQQELNPEDGDTEFGKMMIELNRILSDVFPSTKLLAATNLSDAEVIKPKFDIEMSSNTKTPIQNQGTGVIRSAVFAMLRYRSLRENTDSRPLLIGFEEPEIYLHPNAANQMRDTIYELASSGNNQIVCTTHSTFMIDLGRKPSQILNSLSEKEIMFEKENDRYSVSKVVSNPFNISQAFKKLQGDERSYMKMLVKMDDNMSKVFFAKNVLIVEGDTEEIVFKETITRMPPEIKKYMQHNWEIVKARGKATIISLVKYLHSLGIQPYVIHDADEEKDGARKFNDHIVSALGDNGRQFMVRNCIEDVLGYTASSSDKPFKAYEFISREWGEDWNSIPTNWTEIVQQIFSLSIVNGKVEIEDRRVNEEVEVKS